jgi:hypothetical protein
MVVAAKENVSVRMFAFNVNATSTVMHLTRKYLGASLAEWLNC